MKTGYRPMIFMLALELPKSCHMRTEKAQERVVAIQAQITSRSFGRSHERPVLRNLDREQKEILVFNWECCGSRAGSDCALVVGRPAP